MRFSIFCYFFSCCSGFLVDYCIDVWHFDFNFYIKGLVKVYQHTHRHTTWNNPIKQNEQTNTGPNTQKTYTHFKLIFIIIRQTKNEERNRIENAKKKKSKRKEILIPRVCVFVCVYNMSMSWCDVPAFLFFCLCICQVCVSQFDLFVLIVVWPMFYIFFFFVKLTKTKTKTKLYWGSIVFQAKKTAPKLFDTHHHHHQISYNKRTMKNQDKSTGGGKEYFFFLWKGRKLPTKTISMLTTFLHFFSWSSPSYIVCVCVCDGQTWNPKNENKKCQCSCCQNLVFWLWCFGDD